MSLLKVNTVETSLVQNTGGTGSPRVREMPVFRANVGTLQSFSNGTYVKVQLSSVEFDTNSWFDNTTNYRYTPQIAGYYQFSFCVSVNGTGLTAAQSSLWKNGVQNTTGSFVVTSSSADMLSVGSGLVYLNGTTDYVEMYVYSTGSTRTLPVSTTNFLSGFLVRPD